MKMIFRGPFNETASYGRGDVVRMGSGYKVFGPRGFVDTSAPLDLSCQGPEGEPGRTVVGPKGPAGESIVGAKGAKGDKGADGAGFNWRGRYSVGVTYAPNDVVGWDGSSWVCREETTRRPAKGTAWDLMAAAGQQGYSGQRGASGEATGGGSLTPEAAIFTSEAQPGFAVYVVSDTHADNALADDYSTAEVAGLAIARVAAGAAGQYLTEGTLTLESWLDATGSANLVPGAAYYLSHEVAGRLTTTPPASPSLNVLAMVGRALNYRTLDISISVPIQLSEYED